MIWLLGTVILLPVSIFKLPFNMGLVDAWIVLALPIFWLFFVRGRLVISFSYTIPMWFILVGSLASTFAAPVPLNSLIVIMKEVYIFVWFITVAAVLPTLSARDFRLIMIVWSVMVLLHGLLIIAQFLFPELWRATAVLAGRSTEYVHFRPSGLFKNANLAAFNQLLGFVPLLLAGFSKKVTMILGVFLFATMLVTGSMGATLAFMAGLAVAVIIISLSGHLVLIAKVLAQLGFIILLVGGLLYFVIGQNQEYRDHFEQIILGRSERSSEGRFGLWERGTDVLLDHNKFIVGIGPENFRVVDGRGKQLHNDFLAFTVERGMLGTLGLVLFVILAVSRATYLLLLNNRSSDRARLIAVVFLAAMIAFIVESLTHQTFHSRQLWLILAVQEAMLYKITTSESRSLPAPRTLDRLPLGRHKFIGRRDVTVG